MTDAEAVEVILRLLHDPGHLSGGNMLGCAIADLYVALEICSASYVEAYHVWIPGTAETGARICLRRSSHAAFRHWVSINRTPRALARVDAALVVAFAKELTA